MNRAINYQEIPVRVSIKKIELDGAMKIPLKGYNKIKIINDSSSVVLVDKYEMQPNESLLLDSFVEAIWDTFLIGEISIDPTFRKKDTNNQDKCEITIITYKIAYR